MAIKNTVQIQDTSSSTERCSVPLVTYDQRVETRQSMSFFRVYTPDAPIGALKVLLRLNACTKVVYRAYQKYTEEVETLPTT